MFLTSFPGSLYTPFHWRWEKDPGYDWSRDHPESRWKKKTCWTGGVAEYFDVTAV